MRRREETRKRVRTSWNLQGIFMESSCVSLSGRYVERISHQCHAFCTDKHMSQ